MDYQSNTEAYFNDLQKLAKHAQKTLQKEDEEEAKLLTYLPLVERSNLNKEGKVLTRWQERQREWERVQSAITKKLTSKVPRPLMMASTDEYRARMEEYDLIQAAIPVKDRHANSAWEMSLRGGGPIRVAVGHIFSGLECEIDPVLPKPRIVRKPKSSTTWKTESFVPKTAAYQTRRRQLLKSITEMRPRDVSFQDADALVVKAVDLFKWARESSQAHLQMLDDEEAAAREELSIASMHSLHEDDHEQQQNTLPRIELLSTREVLFETRAGVECVREVSFRNTGDATITFRWDQIDRRTLDAEINAPRMKTPNKSKVAVEAEVPAGMPRLLTLLDAKGPADDSTRSHTLVSRRDTFFCLQNCGELLPGEVASTPFTFRDCAGGGYYASTWVLRLSPPQSRILYNTPAQNGQENSVSSVGSLRVFLSAHCVVPDETMTKRSTLQSSLQAAELGTFMGDIVADCLKRVRQPVRKVDLERRQINLFQEKNKGFIEGLCKVDGLIPPLFFSVSRVRSLQQVNLDTEAFYHRLMSAYHGTVDEYNQLAGRGAGASVLSVATLYALDDGDFQQILGVLFPEHILEIFDEVDESDVRPLWDYDLSRLLQSLDNLLPIVLHLQELEKSISQMRQAIEKLRLKAERKAARLAAGDSDEEDEEEPDEEVEEDSDRPPPPLHAKLVELRSLRARTTGGTLDLASSPLSTKPFEVLVKSMWAEKVLDNMDSYYSNAIATAQMQDFVTRGVPIPVFPSPFTSPEGAEAWDNAMKLTSPIAEPVATGKGAAKPAKNAPPPTAPTQQQVDFFHKEFFVAVREGILSACESMFGDTMQLVQESVVSLHSGHLLAGKPFDQLAVPRAEDVTDKMLIIAIDCDVLVESSDGDSAFSLQANALQRMVSYLVQLLIFEPKGIVLVAESADHHPASQITAKVEQLRSLVEQKWTEHVSADSRARRKLKQPPRSYRGPEVMECATCAESLYRLGSLLRNGTMDMSSGSAASYFAKALPILFVENLRCPGALPVEPNYVAEESDDDEAPVYVGKEEAVAHSRQKWERRRPFRLPVTLRVGGSKVVQECYCDAPPAVRELLVTAGIVGDEVLWIDACSRSLFDPLSSFNMLHAEIEGKRMMSSALREVMGWCAVLRSGPSFLQLIKDGDSAMGKHLVKLLPQCAAKARRPSVVMVLGGELRADKLRLLDEMITLVRVFPMD